MTDRQNNESTIVVSAILITYNQEKYVGQAIESMLCQQTSFRFEILVGDDCSTDGTASILREYADKYPDLITLNIREKNVGANRNAYDLFKMSAGEFITVLEGDDYWLGTDRLQTLVDFMKHHPEYAGVSHKRERRDTNGNLLGYDPANSVLDKAFTVNDFLAGKRYSVTGSLFKNFYTGSGDKYEAVYHASRNVGDFFLAMITLDIGNVFILDRVFGVYRVRIGAGETNYNSIMSPVESYTDHITMIRYIENFFQGKYSFTKEYLARQCSVIMYCIKQKKMKEFIKIRKTIKFWEYICLFFILPFKMFYRALVALKKVVFKKSVRYN